MFRTRNVINWLRIPFGIVFLVSSLFKIISFRSFMIEVGEYIDLYMPQWLHDWNMLCSIGICVLELLIGLLAFWRRHVKWMCVLSLLLLTFFVWLTGVNLFFPTFFGRVESCGCFGELVHFTPIGSFVKSVGLWLLAFIIFIMLMADRKHV